MKAHQHDNKHIQNPPFKKIQTFINIGGKQKNNPRKDWLVVSTHLKNISQIGSFPQVGVKIKNIWSHQLVTIAIIIWIWNIVLVDSILRNITFVLEYAEFSFAFHFWGRTFSRKKIVSIKIIMQSKMSIFLVKFRRYDNWAAFKTLGIDMNHWILVGL